MLQILIFEWLTSGGMLIDKESPDPNCPFQRQGRAMLETVASDFRHCGCEVVAMVDHRLEKDMYDFQTCPAKSANQVFAALKDLTRSADGILLIAPEMGNRLPQVIQAIAPDANKLLSPDLAFVELASHKNNLAAFLIAKGFKQLPVSISPAAILDFDLQQQSDWIPLVCKPIDGAGSDDVCFINDVIQLQQKLNASSIENFRLERFVQGVAVSQSIIFHDAAPPTILPPTQQIFTTLPFGHYRGAEYPLSHDLSQRANRLTEQVIPLLPPTRGYVGFDMVLHQSDPAQDCLIEINPRLTTSYLKLREVCSFNLAEAMLKPIEF